MTSTTVDLFPRAFLIVFHQLAVGGFISLSIPPFHEIARGYYKSTAFVYLLSAVFALIGRIILWTGPAGAAQDGWRIVLWGVFVLVAAAYVATLWADPIVLRARLFTATLALGLIALVVTAVSYVPEPGLSLELMLYPAAFITSALLLGAAASGMLLGHWYLIDRDLSLTPFRNTLRFYVACLVAQTLLLVLGALLLLLGGTAVARLGVEQLVSDHWRFLIARCLVSPIGASVLAWMIWRTLQVPQTMAATGLFYIAILAVMVGEFMGRYLLFRTGIPV